jgi:hypothetical protein
MARLDDLITLLKDELLIHRMMATVDEKYRIHDKILEPVTVDSTQILFANQGGIRVTPDKIPEVILNNLKGFLYLVRSVSVGKVEICYLPFNGITMSDHRLDIGIPDGITNSFHTTKNALCFQAEARQLLFIRRFEREPDKNFIIQGLRIQAHVKEEDGKWTIQRILEKPFSKDADNFSALSIYGFSDVQLMQPERVSARSAIQDQIESGKSLIELWKKYSELELDEARDVQQQIGSIPYYVEKRLRGGQFRLRLELDRETIWRLEEHRGELQNAAFIVSGKPDNTPDMSDFSEDDTESDRPKLGTPKLTVKLVRINSDYSMIVEDEDGILRDEGFLTLSIIGNEVVNKRRIRARDELLRANSAMAASLFYAIEGKQDLLPSERRGEKPISPRVTAFLNEKFKVDELTANQKEAVDIAINTPDIAIIQGPPGTGKSTVIAAICERLLELAEKDGNKIFGSKCILVSAFQNDTVEHISSKIYTLGLPAIKIGKAFRNNNSEVQLKAEMLEKIEGNLAVCNAKESVRFLSQVLSNCLQIYQTELKPEKVLSTVESFLHELDLEEQQSWKTIKQLLAPVNEKDREAIDVLPETRKQFDDEDGDYKIVKCLKTSIPFTQEDREFLATPAILNDAYFETLRTIKTRYLNATHTYNSAEDETLISWMRELIGSLKQKEELEITNEYKFIAANLLSMKQELLSNPDYIRETIRDYTDTIAATNQVAGGYEVSLVPSIHNVILEEAARSNPLDLLIPMIKGTQRVILVGDHKQLPHLLEHALANKLIENEKIAGNNEAENNLNRSLFKVMFENLQQCKTRRVITLTEQFRMHPVIGEFIGRVYYPEDNLRAGSPDQAKSKSHAISLPWAKGKVAVFKNVPLSLGPEFSDKSRYRPAEVKAVFDLLDQLMSDPASLKLSIGIISFYSRQVNDLFSEGEKRKYVIKNESGGHEIAPAYRELGKDEKLRIGTVDSFQGKEFDIVILSPVRSNNLPDTDANLRSKYGFLLMENRLNVAFSRAKRMIIVAGDAAMFETPAAQRSVRGLHEFYTQLSTDPVYGHRL